MRVKCSVYIATSVDGYIARPDGDIEWLHNPKYAESKMNGLQYEDFVADIDAIVMGRNSYEKVRTFGFWPYEDIPVIVLTSHSFLVPDELKDKVQIYNLPPPSLVSVLAQQGYRHLYIDGGKTIQGFLNADLIDELTVTHIPILLGEGIRLFENVHHQIELNLITSASSDNGFVQSRYTVRKQV
ncbi:MAG: dihydrofolate reductase family protein [Gammaproteobacteria bacterium]|nr:dihydrofolate reductase family protein [Gammaproteobacteria bacterium]